MPKQSHIKRAGYCSVYVPKVSYSKSKESYLIFQGNLYAVASCPSHIFRSAVLALAPQWRTNEEYSGLLACPKELVTRWYLINALCEADHPMTLYACEDSARRAMVVGVG